MHARDARRPPPAPATPPSARRPRTSGYVAIVDGAAPLTETGVTPAGGVRAIKLREAEPAPGANAPLREARGYRREDLFAVAEVAYHYLMNGGTRVALTLFDGLAAVAPDEAYFTLALGFCHDRLGDRALAAAHYRRAGELAPGDGRPDVNRAELLIEEGHLREARELLARGAAKAERSGDGALTRKATTLLHHLERRGGGGPRVIGGDLSPPVGRSPARDRRGA